LLAFGGHHHHIDPKTGLALYGPYTVREQERPPLSTITVGVIGPPRLIFQVKEWLNACQHPILNDGRQPFLNPHFPGFSRDFPFQCELVYGETWEEIISEDTLKEALRIPDYHERLARVAKLYVDGIHNLKERQPSPQVVVLPISDETLEKNAALSAAVENMSADGFCPKRKARFANAKSDCSFCSRKWISHWALRTTLSPLITT
jgi:hypothetical protein